ncbi:MAG: C40 family peptidase [Methylobacteriaceae bacterium]|nr:C40 family peptidase [Methylobacteriaceae bacterium]
MTISFDRRFTPARPDLAAAHLKGHVEAATFVEGRDMRIVAPIADVRSGPTPDASLDTQALCGERVTVYEENEGWAWGQLTRDSYVGYLPSHMLRPALKDPTHRVAALRTFVYPAPNMKVPPLEALPLGAEITVEDEGDYARVADHGFVYAPHLRPLSQYEPDFVAVAERFVGVPYLWGGKTALGLDCSGLVQVSLAAAGIAAPRDTDVQAREIGAELPLEEPLHLRRGDLVFWKGHVGIMCDEHTLLHANAHHMLVAREPFTEARARILANSFGAVTAVRRRSGR